MRHGSTGGDVYSLIISPTRELAQQIASEAKMVLEGAGLADKVGVQVFVGGTNVNADARAVKSGRLHIVVAVCIHFISIFTVCSHLHLRDSRHPVDLQTFSSTTVFKTGWETYVLSSWTKQIPS